MPTVAHVPLVAIVDRHGGNLDLLTTTLPILGYRVLPVPAALPSTAAAIRSWLGPQLVDLVVWDMSPVLSSECAAFLDVFHGDVFPESAVLLTTSSASGLRAALGAYCPLALVVDWPATLTEVTTAVEALCLTRRGVGH